MENNDKFLKILGLLHEIRTLDKSTESFFKEFNDWFSKKIYRGIKKIDNAELNEQKLKVSLKNVDDIQKFEIHMKFIVISVDRINGEVLMQIEPDKQIAELTKEAKENKDFRDWAMDKE